MCIQSGWRVVQSRILQDSPSAALHKTMQIHRRDGIGSVLPRCAFWKYAACFQMKLPARKPRSHSRQEKKAGQYPRSRATPALPVEPFRMYWRQYARRARPVPRHPMASTATPQSGERPAPPITVASSVPSPKGRLIRWLRPTRSGNIAKIRTLLTIVPDQQCRMVL
ncbi:MAG: hypothetical protein DDT34_02294 [Firmicutes bacterium]|nr:hypothetical protein [Bacillota bacterium]